MQHSENHGRHGKTKREEGKCIAAREEGKHERNAEERYEEKEINGVNISYRDPKIEYNSFFKTNVSLLMRL